MNKTMHCCTLRPLLRLPPRPWLEDISEFRIGILGGENAQDRLNNNECLRANTPKKRWALRPSCSRPPTITA